MHLAKRSQGKIEVLRGEKNHPAQAKISLREKSLSITAYSTGCKSIERRSLPAMERQRERHAVCTEGVDDMAKISYHDT